MCFKTTGFPVTDKEEDDYKNEDDTPALSLSLGEQLKLDQSILQNVDIEPPTEENNGKWEISSFVEPIAENSYEQFV